MKHNQMKALTKAFCRGNRWNYALSMASTALFVAINLVIAWLMQQLIDVTTGGAQTLSILQLAILSAIIVGGLLLNGLGWRAIFWDPAFRTCCCTPIFTTRTSSLATTSGWRSTRNRSVGIPASSCSPS